ncbi:MAG: DJ-1/PfpI family protein, partial [Caulobacterales bacterium]|nr:DJ-1/PfpI family protein [Caulobacterales bacterium]
MSAKPLHIVFALYPGVTHLDFTGPHQFLSRLPGAQTLVASVQGGEMEADGL